MVSNLWVTISFCPMHLITEYAWLGNRRMLDFYEKTLSHTLLPAIGLVKILNTFNEINMILHTPPLWGWTCFKEIKNWFKYQAAHYELVASLLRQDYPWNWPRKQVGCMLAAGNTIPATAHSETTGQPLRKTARVTSSLLCKRKDSNYARSSGAWGNSRIQMTLRIGLVEESYCWLCFLLLCASQWPQGIQKWGIWPLEMSLPLSKILIWILWMGLADWPIGTSVSPSMPSGIVTKNLCSS